MAFLFDDPRIGLTPSGRMPMPRPRALPLPPHRPVRLPGILERLLPTPGGYEGLLTEEDMRMARGRGLMGFGLGLLDAAGPVVGAPAPSLGQAIAQGIRQGYGEFDSATQGAIGRRQAGQQISEQQRILGKRRELAQHLSPVPGETPKQRADRLQQQVMRYVQAGDIESAQALNGLAIAATQMQQNTDDGSYWRSIGGHDVYYDKNGRELKRVPRTPNPRDPEAPSSAEVLRRTRLEALTDRFTDDYNRDTKETRDTAENIINALGETQHALRGDAGAQVNMLYAFVSAMDPGTAVKEGETALVRSAASLRQRAQGLIDRYVGGESVVIPGDMVQQIAELMQRRLQGMQRYVNGRRKYYLRRAERAKLENPDELFPLLDIPEMLQPRRPVPGAASPHRPVGGDAAVIRNYLNPR